MKTGLIRTSSRTVLPLILTFTAFGCTAMPDDGSDEAQDPSEEIGEAQDEIKNGDIADSWTLARAASLGNCTATVIGPRHLLTAAHCKPLVGNSAYFYTGGANWPFVNWDVSREIEAVYYRPGVYPYSGDLTDSNGKFADVAVIRLTSNVPASSTVATMAWSYPAGGDDWGTKVGCGNHGGYDNTDDLLESIGDWTYSDNDDDGHFLTENEQTDPGDSGGPFYYSNRVLGTLWGDVFEWEMRNKYTSVPFHLPWILSVMGYTFPGTVSTTALVNGTTYSTLYTSTSQECSYVCAKSSSCVGFNYIPYQVYTPCELKSSITGTTIQGGVVSGMK